MNTLDLRIRLQPKQSQFWQKWDESTDTRIGFGGARGGAKSGGGRRCMILRRLKYANTTGIILRRTFPDLYKSHIIKLYEEFPELIPYYNGTNKELALPNGSRLFFGSAEHEKDMAAFYSAEFADIWPDEAQEFSQGELEKLSGSNRCASNTAITPKMVYSFMPGMSESGLPPKGLSYLKRVFVDKELGPEEKKERWGFIQAFSWDNYQWAKKELEARGVDEKEFYSWSEKERQVFFLEHTEYGRKLAAITDAGLRNAWLFGKWDTFQGQYYPQFDPRVAGKHIITREQLKERVKPWHRKTACGDWGFDHPHALYRLAQDETGKLRVYGEIHGRQVNEIELGKTVGSQWAGDPKIDTFVFSWDAGKLSARSNPKFPRSISQLLGDALPAWMPKPHPAESSPGSRIAGARLLAMLLDSQMIEICEDCPRLIECIPSLLRDPDNPEDVLKIDYAENYIGDDPFDAVRMGAQYMLGAADKPKIHDPRSVMAGAQKYTGVDAKAARSFGKWDKGFGKDPEENSWFPKA